MSRSRKLSAETILQLFKNSVMLYNNDCSHDMNRNVFFRIIPSTVAADRKVSFLMLLASLQNSYPEKIIAEVFKFYQKHNELDRSSRLVYYIEKTLFAIFPVEKRAFTACTTREYVSKAHEEELRQRSELERIVHSFTERAPQLSSATKFHDYL